MKINCFKNKVGRILILRFQFLSLIFLLFVTSCFNQDIESKEYPIGYSVDEVLSPLEQLKSFPLPRYTSSHKLLRNYNWISSIHVLGGAANDTTLTKVEKVKNAVAIQEELADNWNYYIHLGNSSKLASSNMERVETDPYSAFIDLANRRPDLPVSVTTFWLGGNLKKIGRNKSKAYIGRTELDKNMYLETHKSQMGFPVLSFDAPDSLLEYDGLTQKYYFDEIAKKLRRPINIINENGETRPHSPIHPRTLRKDTGLVKSFEESGETNWYIYQAKNKLRFRKKFKDAFFGTNQLMDSTLFTWYGVDGNKRWRFDWKISRTIMSEINGQYYSTGDFYPRWPSNWKKGKGAWHGWNWYKGARANELKSGDKLCSPFVAAGWDRNPEKNIRPSQWLALLKHLSVTGAEYFNTGFFNMKNPLPDPKNYFWQAVIPSYAQAITSQYEEILRKGAVLKNAKDEYIFEVKSENEQAIISVRKLEKKYIIVGSLQPSTLSLFDIPDAALATCTIEGRSLTFEVRKQGSVYYADFSNEESPTFYQLDRWHEKGHPQNWTKDVLVDAVLYDVCKNCETQTEIDNNEPSHYDFSKSSSFVRLKGEKSSNPFYSLPLKKDTTYKLSLKVRCANTKDKSKIKCFLNGEEISTLKIKENKWVSYEFGKIETGNKGESILEISSNSTIDLKEILLKRN